MNDRMEIIEEDLTKMFKGKYLNEDIFGKAVNKITRKYFMPAGYCAKAVVDPYGKQIIRVECVKV